MTNQYFLARFIGRDPNIRAADEDRERVAGRLRKAHAEGRIDLAEFQERLERCYESKTYGELGELVRDLPRQDEQPERRSFVGFAPWHWRLRPLTTFLVALIVLSVVSGHHHILWFWLPLTFLFWRVSWWRHRQRWANTRRSWNDWI